MSTSAQFSPEWKEEVNRRVAQHRGRKTTSAPEPQMPAEIQNHASRRAMEAAARVAARYAHAPSYSEVLASEARAALRAAEAASRAALEAQAAAQSVLDGIEAASAAAPAHQPAPTRFPEPAFAAPKSLPTAAENFPADDDFLNWAWPEQSRPEQSRPDQSGPELVHSAASSHPPSPQPAIDPPLSIHWDAALPMPPAEPAELRATRGQAPFATGAEDWWRPASFDPDRNQSGPIEIVEPAQPLPANLIEFPRELVATRKARPRLVEAPHAAAEVQLSIFEVDPVSLPLEPAFDAAAEPAQPWVSPTWSGMELEAHPAEEYPEILEEPAAQTQHAPALEPAPASLRLMALVVDGALIAGSLLGAATMALSHAHTLPGPRAAEIGMALGLLLVAALYETFFFTLGRATPGMKYARIRLITFEGHLPARPQRCGRLAALLVSALPVGLGVAWALFDEDQLTWHDRLSRTYLCKR